MAGRQSGAVEAAVAEFRADIAAMRREYRITRKLRTLLTGQIAAKHRIHRTTLWRALRRKRNASR